MGEVKDGPGASESSIREAGEKEYGGCSCLGEEVFSCCFYCPGVMFFGEEGENSEGIYF